MPTRISASTLGAVEPSVMHERRRMVSLDMFRGLTVLGMVLVDKPGSWDHLYWPLEHAHWSGWTPTDFVFPFFVYIVGASLALSLANREAGGSGRGRYYRRVAQRTLVLVLLGLVLNQSTSFAEFLFRHAESPHFETWRIPGVLQRIGLVYAATAVLVTLVSIRTQVAVALSLLLGYWALLCFTPHSGDYQRNIAPDSNVVRLVDRAVIGANHLYTQGKAEKTDPEGILSTFPAIVTALLGYWAATYLRNHAVCTRTVARLAVAGAVIVAVGLLWGELLPVMKKLWTSSFVLLTGGTATIAFAGCALVYDVAGWTCGARALQAVGVNAISVYVGSWIVEVTLDTARVGGESCKQWVYTTLFTSWAPTPESASLAFALATTAVWWLVAITMHHGQWKVTV